MLTFLKAGLYTTVQDSGRFMGAHLGIPCSGPMDRQSADIANLMLNNDKNDALLECTYVGPQIQFHEPTTIAIKGAEVTALLNGESIDNSHPISIHRGDILSIGKIQKGCRVYLALKGGIQSDLIYGSRSTCTTANILQALKNNSQLNYNPSFKTDNGSISIKRILGNSVLEASVGPEFDILTKSQKVELIKTEFKILPTSNRMAYRTSHDSDFTHNQSILSSGTMPGTVQLTSSGDLICLMRDCQTTGGYPRILQLTESAVNDLSQLMPSQKFMLKIK